MFCGLGWSIQIAEGVRIPMPALSFLENTHSSAALAWVTELFSFGIGESCTLDKVRRETLVRAASGSLRFQCWWYKIGTH